MKGLLNRTKPKLDESLYSYLHRLALVNHYEHLGSLFIELKSAAYAENCNEIHESLYWVEHIRELLNALNIDIFQLTVNKFDKLLTTESIRSVKRVNYRKFYRRYSTKFCPECMREDFYHRIYWDLNIVTTCVKHRKDLVSYCSNCKDPIILSRLMRNKCRCGKKYTSKRSKTADAVSLKVQAILQGFLLQTRKKVLRSSDKKWLYIEDYFTFFKEYFDLIHNKEYKLFQVSRNFSIKGKIIFLEGNLTEINLPKWKLIANIVHFLIVDPQQDFTNLVDDIFNGKKQKTKFTHTRSHNFKTLKRIFSASKGEHLLELYNHYLDNKKDEYINQRHALPATIKNKKYLTLGESLKMLRSEHHTMMNLCKHKLIKLSINYQGGRKVMLIERESIEQYQEMKKNSFTLMQMYNYFNMNFHHAKELLRVKLITPTHGPDYDGYDIWYIAKEEVERFKKKLNSKIIPLPASNDEKLFTIKQATHKFLSFGLSVGEIYLLIFNDKLKICNIAKKNSLNGIRVLGTSLEEVLQAFYYQRINDSGYTSKAIERACKIDGYTVKKLVDKGVLTLHCFEEGSSRMPKVYIDKKQVKEFLKKYKGRNNEEIRQHLAQVEEKFLPRL